MSVEMLTGSKLSAAEQLHADILEIEKYAREMYKLTGMWGVFLDYEYNESNQKFINPVCCSVAFYNASFDQYMIHEYWLHNNVEGQDNLEKLLSGLSRENHVMVAYSVGAEGRGTLSLNKRPDIRGFKWIDLYLEWLQIKNKNNDMLYGKYIGNGGFRRHSVPPSFDPSQNEGKDNTAISNRLVDCVYKITGDIIDSKHKDAMRDLILECKPFYDESEQHDIMSYCTSDIKYLARIWHFATLHLKKKIRQPISKIVQYQLYRGSFGCSGALMETVGLPTNKGKLLNLRRNYDSAANAIIKNVNDNYYPFFELEKKLVSEFVGNYVDKYDNFVAYVKSIGLYKDWPRTYNKEKKQWTDTLSRENKTLKKFDNLPVIRAYRYAKKNLNQLNWLRAPHTAAQIKAGDFFDSVGDDDHVRTFLGLYGTQTARNAPKASRFILAMSSWMRCTIEPPEGYIIIAVDYASQEFAIAAIRSNDRAMIEAYVSGDPYIFFAKKYGSIPKEAVNQWVKNPSLAPEAEREQYKKYKGARALAKGVVLGLQFGLGYKNLAIQLTADTGQDITEEKSLELVNFHKQLFSKYWDWLTVQYNKYLTEGYLQLPNGWCLLGDNDNELSVKNFPVQGMGANIMQDAVLQLHNEYSAKIITPLHDALYVLVPESQVDQWKEIITYCMTQAVYKNLGNKVEIRLDVDVHRRGELWLEEKGEDDYKMLHKYLDRYENLDDRKQRLIDTIYTRVAA